MYFYKEIRKKEELLSEQLSEWCMDDYNCFIQKYLLGDDYFDCSVDLDHTTGLYKRPFIRNYSYIETDHAKKHLWIFIKTEDSFLFDDEKIELKSKGKDIISQYCNVDNLSSYEESLRNWFVWIIPAASSYKDELQEYIDSCNSETIHTKIVYWEDLLDEYAKSRKNCAAEKEIKLTYKLLSQTVHSIKDYYPAEENMQELLITANDFNSSCCKRNRWPQKQSILELTLNPVESDLDSSVSNKLNNRKEEIKKSKKILLIVDDDREGKAIKDSIIKYFRNEHPEVIKEQRLECITFPKYFIEPNEISDGDDVNSIEELEKVIEEWNEDTLGKSFTVKKGISSLEEMGGYSQFYLDAVINYQKHRKVVE